MCYENFFMLCRGRGREEAGAVYYEKIDIHRKILDSLTLLKKVYKGKMS